MSGNENEQQCTNPNGLEDVSLHNDPVATEVKSPNRELDTGVNDPTDGRKRFQWESFYSSEAKKIIRNESIYLFLILIGSQVLIFAAWKGWINSFFSLSSEEAITLRKYTYYSAAGMLGGGAFGVKYFYRVVARGYWHLDRRIWRYMSPFLIYVPFSCDVDCFYCGCIDRCKHNWYKRTSFWCSVCVNWVPFWLLCR